MSNVTREAKTSGTKKNKIGFISVQKNNTKEATHQLNVSYFDHLIEISI